MRRPGKAVKTQRRKTLRRRNASKAARRRGPLAAGKETNVARLARERDEALEQLAATSEMLQVISRSPGELEPVFESMLANAARICEARFAILYLHDGSAFRAVAATHDAPPAYVNRASATGQFDLRRTRHLGAWRARNKSPILPTSVSFSPTSSAIHLSSPLLNSADFELRLEFRC